MDKELDDLLNSIGGFTKEKITKTDKQEKDEQTQFVNHSRVGGHKHLKVAQSEQNATEKEVPFMRQQIADDNKRPIAAIAKKRNRKSKIPIFEVIPDADRRSRDYATVRIRKDVLKALKIFFDEKKQYVVAVEMVLVAFLNQNKQTLIQKIRKYNPLGI